MHCGAIDRMVNDLAARLDEPVMRDASVIRWGSPIPAFGDISSAKIATVGLNPSNNEFVDKNGAELTGKDRRFHTLASLSLERWSDLKKRHVEKIVDSYAHYFNNNPYDTWFAQLDFIISASGSTFYGPGSNACHLDLVPYATECKWTSLSTRQKALLFSQSGSVLVDCVNTSKLGLLILNGQSVVDAFQSRFGIDFIKAEKPTWKLCRKTGGDVRGFAYVAETSVIAGRRLNRNVRILGFNHNLQSSFGVTGQVRESIRRWVARKSVEKCR